MTALLNILLLLIPNNIIASPTTEHPHYSVRQNDIELLGLKGSIKTYTDGETGNTYCFDQHKNLTRSKERRYKDNSSTIEEFVYDTKYDEEGKKKEVFKRKISPTIETWYTEYNYNTKKQLIERTTIGRNGIEDYYRFIYDKNGHLSKYATEDHGKLQYTNCKTCSNCSKETKDKNGNLVIEQFDQNGALYSTEKKGKNGELLYFHCKDSIITPTTKELLRYDSKGNLIEKVGNEYKYTYQYDANNNKVNTIRFTNGSLNGDELKSAIEYYP